MRNNLHPDLRQSPIRIPQSAICLLACLLGASAAFSDPAEDYLNAQLRGAEGIEKQVREIALLADEAARRLGQSGQIYLAGEPGMVAELLGRAGGLCGAKAVQPGKKLLNQNDAVLFSNYDLLSLNPKNPVWEETAKAGSLVVPFFTRDAWVQSKPFHDAFLSVVAVETPYAESLVEFNGPRFKKFLVSASPAFAIAEWTFTAEMIGACRRQGKQLAIYLSIHLDEGQKRFKRTQGLLFEPDLKPEPVPPGQYAREFLGHVRAALEAVKHGELGKIRQAAAWLREAREAKQKRVAHLYGHMAEAETLNTGPDALFTDRVRGGPGAKSIEWIRANQHKGDVYLFLGYQQNEDAMAAAANELGARTIFLTSLPPSPEQAKNPLHLYVNPHWPLNDACLDLPGYDVKACPLSGIMGLTTYYAICAEALGGK